MHQPKSIGIGGPNYRPVQLHCRGLMYPRSCFSFVFIFRVSQFKVVYVSLCEVRLLELVGSKFLSA